MGDEKRTVTDDMLLSELTVGEFKALVAELLAAQGGERVSAAGAFVEEEELESVPVKRQSLDEFMSDLSSG